MKKIVIIDQDTNFAKQLCYDILRVIPDCPLKIFHSPNQALQYIEQEHTELVVMAYEGGEGYSAHEFYQRLRIYKENIPTPKILVHHPPNWTLCLDLDLMKTRFSRDPLNMQAMIKVIEKHVHGDGGNTPEYVRPRVC